MSEISPNLTLENCADLPPAIGRGTSFSSTMTVGIPNIELKHLYRLEATLDAKMEVSTGPYGFRRCVPTAGRTFERDRMEFNLCITGRKWFS